MPAEKMVMSMSGKQAEFLDCDAMIKGFCGGRGAGKSVIGAYETGKAALEKKDRLFVVVTDNYKRLKRSSYRTFCHLWKDFIVDTNLTDLWVKMLSGTQVDFRTGNDPDLFRGPNYSHAWIDEASLVSEEVFQNILACLRENGEQGRCISTFTPKGKGHWTYNTFGKGKAKTTYATTKDNPFLPENFSETVAEFLTTTLQEQELGGRFIDVAGALFNPLWFNKFFVKPIPNMPTVRYWDLAATEPKDGNDPDFAVGVRMSKCNKFYFIEDVQRFRLPPAQVEARIALTSNTDGPRTVIRMEQEPGASGKMVISTFKKLLTGRDFRGVCSSGDKYTRAVPYAAACERGKVAIRRNAPWLQAFVDEHQTFPEGKHDDIIDACSGAFNYLSGYKKAGVL